jgi:hypothetical protein
MPRGVKKNLEAVEKRTANGRASKTLAEQRIKGDAPAIGLVALSTAQKTRLTKVKKPALKKTNSKGEVVKRKGATTPYYAHIKRCIKLDGNARKGTYVIYAAQLACYLETL